MSWCSPVRAPPTLRRQPPGRSTHTSSGPSSTLYCLNSHQFRSLFNSVLFVLSPVQVPLQLCTVCTLYRKLYTLISFEDLRLVWYSKKSFLFILFVIYFVPVPFPSWRSSLFRSVDDESLTTTPKSLRFDSIVSLPFSPVLPPVGLIQKGMQRSSLLVGRRTFMPH